MGDLSFASFKEQLKMRAGRSTAWSSVGDDALDYYGIWINKAYMQLCSAERFPGLKRSLYFPQLYTSTSLSTTDGTAYISTPSRCLYVEDIFNETSNGTLDNISWREYLEHTDRDTAASESRPSEWTRKGELIYLHPTPDAVYSLYVYYKKLPNALSGTSSTTIGAEWDDAVLALAAQKMFMWIGEPDKAKMAGEEFLQIVNGLSGVYANEEEDREAYSALDPAYWKPDR